jgi:hypothetical protein
MSPEQQAFYGMRSLVESSRKMLMEAGREDIANKRKRSGRGYAFRYLAAALAAASTNLRKIESFFLPGLRTQRRAEAPHSTSKDHDRHGARSNRDDGDSATRLVSRHAETHSPA